MPRENSFSDSDGRSLTPDLEDEAGFPPVSPTSAPPNFPDFHPTRTRESVRSRTSRTRPLAPPFLHHKERFRHIVRKVIALHRGTNLMAQRGAGAEPGVDPRRAEADAEFGGIMQQCVIEVVDYSAVRSSFGRMKNREFVELMNNPEASAREPWVKVRWINIGGMSWDVIKAVSIKYDLQPLALEDVFHAHPRARSKVDYYTQHLFLRILCHELGEVEEFQPNSNPVVASLPRSESLTGFKDDEKTLRGSVRKRRPVLPTTPSDFQHAMRDCSSALRALKSGERVNVNVSPMFIFLFRDGTVISIHSTPSLDMTEPITNRLRQFDTGLRTSADASLLVQSLLSLVADKALEVVDAYKAKIQKFERQIMLKPDVTTVRNLHILSADLILHRRTLEPIKTVVYGLRRYDVDRATALVDSSGEGSKGTKVVGFMSHKTIIYLADVHSHMEYVLSQLDDIASIGQNLVDYTFNVCLPPLTDLSSSFLPRRLMIATVVFLPLTLLTGYFGMNFTDMWSVNGHSDWVFWAIALPIMAIVVPSFVAPDIQRMVHYIQKRALAKKVVESFK
ncbi:magnesium transporter [Mycena vulgaris]|nr:magnesium transporter [Mycena vulgaris]